MHTVSTGILQINHGQLVGFPYPLLQKQNL